MKKEVRYSHSPAETKRIAREIVSRAIEKHVSPHAVVISISGELGMGKTSFVRGAAPFFGIPQKNITSPTFILFKKHRIKKQKMGFRFLYHADAYRIDTVREFVSIGFEKIAGDPKSIVCVEWGERIRDLLPENTIRVSMSPGRKKNERMISINY